MRAIILAAGQAKRLKSITNNLPKCLLTVGKKRIIDYQIEGLNNNGIKEIIVVVGFCKQKLTNYLKKRYPWIKFIFIANKNFQSTGPAFSLSLAKKYLINPVLYLNADLLCSQNIIKKVIQNKKPAVTAIQRVPWDIEEVNMIVNDNLQILEIGKHINKQLSYGEFIGITKFGKQFNKKLIKALNYFNHEKYFNKFAADSINLAIQQWNGKMYVLDVTDLQAIEIDTPEDYTKAKKLFNTF